MATTHATRLARIESTLAAQGEVLARLAAHLDADAPAKTARKAPAKRKAAKRKPAPKVTPTKGATAQGHGTGMTRKDWNKTLATKARFAGGGTYKAVMADWAEIQTLRAAGNTPDEVLSLFV